MNNENLIPLNTLPKSRQREIQQKGTKAAAEARKRKRLERELIEILNELPASDTAAAEMAEMGIPDEMHTQQTMRILALHKKAVDGDVGANKLILEIMGELKKPTVSLEYDDETGFVFRIEDCSGG